MWSNSHGFLGMVLTLALVIIIIVLLKRPATVGRDGVLICQPYKAFFRLVFPTVVSTSTLTVFPVIFSNAATICCSIPNVSFSTLMALVIANLEKPSTKVMVYFFFL